MATSESKYIRVTAEQISCTKNAATYRCTITRINKGVYVLCDKNYHLAPKKSGDKPFMLWGFPTDYSKYNYTAASNLKNGTTVDIGAGYGKLPSKIQNSITWEESVPISRGNSRQGTKTISVGLKTGTGGSKDFKPALIKLTLKTKEIPKPNKPTISVTVDDTTNKDRFIHVTVTMNNPEEYYIAKLYDKNGNQIGDPHTASWNEQIPINKNMFESSQEYTVKIIGKDTSEYHSITSNRCYIEASGIGVIVKDEGILQEVNTAHLKNVNIKTLSEVWVKKDGKVYQIRK